jgi:hypothetical protein
LLNSNDLDLKDLSYNLGKEARVKAEQVRKDFRWQGSKAAGVAVMK